MVCGNSDSAGTASLGGICQGETNHTFGDCEGSPKRIMGDTGWQRPEGGEQRAGGAVQPSESVNWVVCPDGKTRPLKPGLPLLADGILGRTSIIHALGNAIVPQVAASVHPSISGVQSMTQHLAPMGNNRIGMKLTMPIRLTPNNERK